MEQFKTKLQQVRAEIAQTCQQLADATAALDKVASSVRDLPKLQLPEGGSEMKLQAPRNSGWVAAGSSSGKQKRRTKAAQDVT
jgi:hypothetical protein